MIWTDLISQVWKSFSKIYIRSGREVRDILFLQEKFQIELHVSSFSQLRSYINSMFFLIRCWISTRIKQFHLQYNFSSKYKNKHLFLCKKSKYCMYYVIRSFISLIKIMWWNILADGSVNSCKKCKNKIQTNINKTKKNPFIYEENYITHTKHKSLLNEFHKTISLHFK